MCVYIHIYSIYAQYLQSFKITSSELFPFYDSVYVYIDIVTSVVEILIGKYKTN